MKSLVLVLTFLVLSSSNALAQVNLSGVELDTTSLLLLAAICVTFLGMMWGVRKVIRLQNRS